jgi:hypothetical protein
VHLDLNGLMNITGWFIRHHKMERTARFVFFLEVVAVIKMQ